jgi:hypothetical protein
LAIALVIDLVAALLAGRVDLQAAEGVGRR